VQVLPTSTNAAGTGAVNASSGDALAMAATCKFTSVMLGDEFFYFFLFFWRKKPYMSAKLAIAAISADS